MLTVAAAAVARLVILCTLTVCLEELIIIILFGSVSDWVVDCRADVALLSFAL